MKRTQYMQEVMTSTYSSVAIESIQNGFDGAWERCIAKRLKQDVARDHSQACEIVESVGNDFAKAATLIFSTKTPETV